MSTMFTVTIGRVISTAGMGTAETTAPFPIAKKDRKHSLVKDPSSPRGWSVVPRKGGKPVERWGDGTTVRERT